MQLGLPLTEQEQANRQRLSVSKPLAYAKVMQYDEQLRKGRSTALIQLQYAYTCNFRCSHCSISILRDTVTKRMTPADVRNLMDQADSYGLAHVAISGGEPLMFRDLEEVIRAIDPNRFHIQVDTNGWNMTPDVARKLVWLGVDKVQISLDGLTAAEHDAFRRKKGSHARVLQAIENCVKEGLAVQVATVVDRERARGSELEMFLAALQLMKAAVSVVYAKPVGEWQDREDNLPDAKDIRRVKALLKRYGGYDHTTPCYGQNLGCIAVKRMVAVTGAGDVLPCPWMMFSLGNIYKSYLADILTKGMAILGNKYCPVCRLSESPLFRKTFLSKLKGKQLPVPIEDVFALKP